MLSSTIERTVYMRLRSLLLHSQHAPAWSSTPPSAHYSSVRRSFCAASTGGVTNKFRERTQELRRSVSKRQRKLRARVDVRTAALRQRVHDKVEDVKDTAREIQANPGSMLQTYGPVFVGTYLSLYIVTLSSLTAGIQSGVLDPVQLLAQMGSSVGSDGTTNVQELVVALLQKNEWTAPGAAYVEEYPYLANLGVAWIAAKFTEPVRIPLAVGLTPRVARWIGWSSKKTTT